MASSQGQSNAVVGGVPVDQAYLLPLNKLKTQVLELKHVLAVIMRTAGDLIKQGCSENDEPTAEVSAARTELGKSLDLFYCGCDQIEHTLLLILDCQRTYSDLSQFLPVTVVGPLGRFSSEKADETVAAASKGTVNHTQFVSFFRLIDVLSLAKDQQHHAVLRVGFALHDDRRRSSLLIICRSICKHG
uniref:Mediator of RNA polymerase II transcription subunit 29 n=1 Tax=Trichuris muris TaxID=70415 RepID=A0A5S6QKH6_TRIMR